MDPGTAIGLAGTVYKVVIAGIEFIGDAKQVYAKGGTDNNRDLDAVARDIQSASASLEEQLDRTKPHVASSDGESQINTQDQELRQLAIRASTIGKELSEALGKALIDEKSKFKAFKAVIRGNWNADDIKKIEARLNNVRNELQLRVLVSIRESLKGPQDEPYEPMLTTLESLVKHESQSADDRKRMMESLTKAEELALSLKDEILVTRQQMLAEFRTAQQLLVTSRAQSAGEDTTRKQVEDAILASLWYPDRNDREDSISDAHKKTFEWLLQDPPTSQVPFSSLVGFLGSDTTKAYWITGKPGSGKSTAMKFLLGDPRTADILQHWSGGKRVLRASFYFFYNGGDMQKSELGLLSSLLYALLKQKRALIPVGFKDRFEAALGVGRSSYQRPSIFECRRALTEIIRRNPDLFFFLTVDGLDEFDSNVSTTEVASLLQLTRSLSNLSNTKLILSSRPLSAFEQGFADCPSLAIHDLTRDDIHSYVSDELQSHPRMMLLMSRDEARARTLIQSIGDNSSGVFLWVRLVVKSLLEGLENSDGLEELQARLEELPHDLHTLYSVMLSRIPSNYIPQTAKLIQLVKKDTGNIFELSLLGLWYADQWTDEDLFGTGTNPISQDQIVARTGEMTGRLKSRCLGLIEIQASSMTTETLYDWKYSPTSDIYDPNNEYLNLRVKFIHRTVSEFLSKKDIRARFVDIPSLSTFNPNVALARSAIAMVKEFIPGKPTDWAVLIKLAGYVSSRVRRLSRDLGDLRVDPGYQLKLLKELDYIMSEHMAAQLLAPWDSLGQEHGLVRVESCDAHWSSCYDRGSEELSHRERPVSHPSFTGDVPRRGRQASFMSFLVIVGLEGPLQYLINIHGKSVLRKDGLPLLGYALCFQWPWYKSTTFVTPEVARVLVTNGSSPHEEFCGRTVWDWYLRTKRGCMSYDGLPQARFPLWVGDLTDMRVMLGLLSVGADIHGRIAWHEPSSCRHTFNHSDDDFGQTVTICTLYMAARRSHQLATQYVASGSIDTNKGAGWPHTALVRIKSLLGCLVKLLEDDGAIEQEWDLEGNLIFPTPTTGDVTAGADENPKKDMVLSHQTLTAAPLKSNSRDAKASAAYREQEGCSVKEEKDGVVESASHRIEAAPNDKSTAVHTPRSRGSRICSKFGSWVKSLTGKLKATS